jgi:hypothetical protein
MSAVIPVYITGPQLTEDLRHRHFSLPEKKMHMVGHNTPCIKRESALLLIFDKKPQIFPMIFII